MRGGRVRRLPVVGEEGALAGLISLADLAREAARESVQRHKELSETDVGDTLATICMKPVQSLSA
jgi:CBS-domain-containing membrane protein